MEWMRIKDAAAYAKCSKGQIRNYFKLGLKHTRPTPKCPLTCREWIDEFLERQSQDDAASIVDDIVTKLKK